VSQTPRRIGFANYRCCVVAQIECDFDWVSDQDVEMAVTPLPRALLLCQLKSMWSPCSILMLNFVND